MHLHLKSHLKLLYISVFSWYKWAELGWIQWGFVNMHMFGSWLLIFQTTCHLGRIGNGFCKEVLWYLLFLWMTAKTYTQHENAYLLWGDIIYWVLKNSAKMKWNCFVLLHSVSERHILGEHFHWLFIEYAVIYLILILLYDSINSFRKVISEGRGWKQCLISHYWFK